MTDETFITQEDLDTIRSIDPRWKAVDLSIRVNEELRSSLAINLVIHAATRRGEDAKDALVFVNPADTQKIIALQADAQCAKLIGEILTNIQNNGQENLKAIHAEEKMNAENRSE